MNKTGRAAGPRRHYSLPSSSSWQVRRPGSVAELAKGHLYCGNISAWNFTIWEEKKGESPTKCLHYWFQERFFFPLYVFTAFFHSFPSRIWKPFLMSPWFLGETNASEKSPLCSIFSPSADHSNKESF